MTSNAPALMPPPGASLPSAPSTSASRDAPSVATTPAAASAAAIATEPLADSARAAPDATTPPAHAPGDHSASPPPSSSLSTEHKLEAAASTSASASKGKRVFVFQKRWLHSLPIMEKTLPEPGVDSCGSSTASATKKLSNDNGTGASSPTALSATGEPLAPSRDVIACMLCDEPGSNHHVTKVWSRLNCRRGRIENHLTSKHPEFMLLLKHKRDTEGELAVQLFLQGMRDGRCSLRSELSLGLLTHQHHHSHHHTHAQSSLHADVYSSSSSSNGGAGVSVDGVAADLKRGFPGASVYTIGRESASTPSNTSSSSKAAGAVFTPPLSTGTSTKTPLELIELETRRKRARLSASGLSDDASPPALASNPVAADSPLSSSVQSSSLEASVLVQWQSVFFNRLVVVTGGENAFIASLATNLWLLGANVLLTFTSVAALDEFTASHAARFPDADAPTASPSASPRGVLFPMLGAFQTRAQMDEWSRTVATKFAKVDFLINFVDDDGDSGERRKSAADAVTATAAAALPVDDAPLQDHASSSTTVAATGASSATDFFVSSANRLLELCQSISTLCFQTSGAGAIVNITTQSDGVRRNMNCAAVESMTKSLALELQPLNVQVNCILLQHPVSLDSAAAAAAGRSDPPLSELALSLESGAQDQQTAALSHTILFLLSPASALVSGSVLRLQHRLSASPLSSSSDSSSGPSAIRDAVVDATTAPASVQPTAAAAAATRAPMDDAETEDDESQSDRVNQIV